MFEFSKRKEQSNSIHAMIMLKENNSFNINAMLDDFKKNYNHKLSEITEIEPATSFEVDGELFGLAHMKVPIPSADLEWAAEVAYNWPAALNDLKEHEGHVIVTSFKGPLSQVEKFKILTRLIFSLLRTTSAVGVYKGNQRLLIKKDDYSYGEMILANNALPINLWICLGVAINDGWH
jgi:hypothetical protein